MTLTEALAIYNGSSGDDTKALYDLLQAKGPLGVIALNLFRASKCSARAKVYRGGDKKGSYRRQAYDRKQWSMDNLCRALVEHSDGIKITWGWGFDKKATGFEHVLYIEAPTGQVSFHTERRGDGPDFSGCWDGIRDKAPTRICALCIAVLNDWPFEEKPTATPDDVVVHAVQTSLDF